MEDSRSNLILDFSQSSQEPTPSPTGRIIRKKIATDNRVLAAKKD
jgi:hypothetical protein